MRVDDDVPYLTGEVRCAAEDLAASQDASADACPEGDEQHVVAPGARPVGALACCGARGVIVHLDRCPVADTSLEPGLHVGAACPRQVGREP